MTDVTGAAPGASANRDRAVRGDSRGGGGGGGGGWLAARLRAAPGGALAFAALVCVAVFTAVALPRAVDASADDAIRAALDRARPADRMLSATASATPAEGPADAIRERVRPENVHRADEAIRGTLASPLEPSRRNTVRGVHNTTPAESDDPGLPRPTRELDPKATLAAQSQFAAHTRLTDGRMPGPRVTGTEGNRRVQAVVTVATARTMRLAPGDTFHLPSGAGGTTVEVTGIVTPRGTAKSVRESPFWKTEEATARPFLVNIPPPTPGGQRKYYWHFSAFLHPSAAPALTEMSDGAELYFHYPDLTGPLRGHQVAATERQLTGLSSGATPARLQEEAGVGRLTFSSGLQETLASYQREQAAVSPLLLIAGLGLATTLLTVLLLAGALTADRRAEEFALLRSRGASLRGLTGRLLTETGALALPAAALGATLALLLVPGTRAGPALLAGAATCAAAALALPLRAAFTHQRVRATSARRDLTRARPSRRRTVLELTVLALVVGAVIAVRQRGAGEGDALSALAPVLLALAAALLLTRCYPLPLRLLGRLTANRRGPIAFIGLARAGRAPSAALSGPALLTLLVALTVASFGGTVLAGIAEGRDHAALRMVGADARIETPDAEDVMPGLARRVREAPGVDDVTTFRSHDDGELVGVTDTLTVLLVDAPAYARLAARNDRDDRDDRDGHSPFPAARLGVPAATADSAPLPALVSPGIAHGLRASGGSADIVLAGLQLPVRAAVVRDETPAVREGDFLVLSRESIARARPDARGTALLAPNTLLASGPAPDGAALRALLRRADPHAHTDAMVSLRSEERAEFADSVLQSGAERLYLAAVLAAAGYSALAVLLSLLQTAPERTALLARLRTLGLPRRQGHGVLLMESLPLYVLTAATGTLTGLAVVPLLGPGIDLSALAGTPEGLTVRLTADPASLVLPPLALLALVTGGLLLQARLTGRGADTPHTEAP